MSHEKLRPKFTIDSDKLIELKKLVPEAFADGKINYDTLKEALGEFTEDEGLDAEHFGLFWPGKREARRISVSPSQGTLAFCKGEGIDEHETKNIFIEGDNLEVLKILQKSYADRIKMIFIDPPYNTGNDFVYEDDFREPISEYLKRTGQLDEKGEILTTNKRSDGRFHSKWLSMMYPRLRIARTLLRDDGLIFITIDDTEAANLKILMDEIFGEENFQQQIIWKNKYGPGALTKGFGNLHEYIICYSKTPIESISSNLSEDEMQGYKNKDSKYSIRGGFVTQPLATRSKDDRPNLVYPIKYKGKDIWPDKQWIWSKERLFEALKNDEVVITETNGKYSVRFKQYLKDENGILRKGKPLSLLLGPFNQEGTKEIYELFNEAVFDFPKPSELIKFLFSMIVNGKNEKNGIYLDFFAGSGSSAQAIFSLNCDDGGLRNIISIQMPEVCRDGSVAQKSGYKTIADICKERIRRASKKYKKELKENENLFKKDKIDLGLKTYKLVKSNYRIWNNVSERSLSELENKLDLFETPLIDNWKSANVISEIILIEGFSLDSKIDNLDQIKKNKIVVISSDYCEHKLLICLDNKLESSTIKNIQIAHDDVFVCLDSAITDQNKMQLSDKCKLKTI